MKSVVIVLLLVLTPVLQAAEQVVAIAGPDFWASPRHGEKILKNKQITEAVKHLLAEPEAYLVLHYPATEFGELWAVELQAWLVSLGLVSDRIDLRPGFEGGDAVEVIVVSTVSEDSETDVTEEGEVHEDDENVSTSEHVDQDKMELQ